MLIVGTFRWMCAIDSTSLELTSQFFINLTDELGNELDKNLFGKQILLISKKCPIYRSLFR